MKGRLRGALYSQHLENKVGRGAEGRPEASPWPHTPGPPLPPTGDQGTAAPTGPRARGRAPGVGPKGGRREKQLCLVRLGGAAASPPGRSAMATPTPGSRGAAVFPSSGLNCPPRVTVTPPPAAPPLIRPAHKAPPRRPRPRRPPCALQALPQSLLRPFLRPRPAGPAPTGLPAPCRPRPSLLPEDLVLSCLPFHPHPKYHEGFPI